MNKKWLMAGMVGLVLLLAGCDYSQEENRDGFFFNTFVQPMDNFLHFLGDNLGNYGLAIVVLTLIVRLIIFPFMMRTYKNQMMMREKMKIVKPEMEEIQKRVKVATTQEEKMAAQQEMMGLYKKHGINPLNMGCLPIILQMPVIMALFFALRYPSEGGITEDPHFLWMDLTQTGDIWMVAIAGIVYFVQAYVSMQFVPEEQRKQMQLFMYISPIMIIWISIISPAALPLYWAVGGIFLIFQTIIGNKFYKKKVHEEMAPIIEAHEREKAEKERKLKNAKVMPKKKKRKK